MGKMMTTPDNFRRDREWPCCVPGCHRDFHTAEQMQIHFRADHTDEEKEAAWAKVPAFLESKRQVFALVPVSLPLMKDAPIEGVVRMDQS